MTNLSKTLAVGSAILALAGSAHSATVTVGPGGFDDGFATTITYDTEARRGDANDRDNALNALGANDGSFFELGFGSTVDLTFGGVFNTSVDIYEVTFGSAANFPESVNVFAGSGGLFELVGTLTNSDASGGATVSLSGLIGATFDTLRLIDTSPLTSTAQSDAFGPLGGFDLDAARVSIAPVPLPAAGMLLLTAIGGLTAMRRRKARS